MLSVTIIAKNESHNIADCIKSVSWADEIIVLDSGSTDNTIAICQSLGAKVIETDWQGYGVQCNRAISHAKHEWILSLDADERITDKLQDEIKQAMQPPSSYDAFRIPRSSSFCGQFMRHSGWTPDYVTRLFKNGRAKFSNDLVHQHLQVNGKIGTLHTPIVHYSYLDLDEVLIKVNEYSTAKAKMLHARGKQSSLSKAIVHAFWAFIRTWVIRLGFLDGKKGFMLAISNAEVTYYAYAKLSLLEQSNIENARHTI